MPSRRIEAIAAPAEGRAASGPGLTKLLRATRLRPVAAAMVTAGTISFGLTFLIYGGALALPFYSDDLNQIPWTKATPLALIWGSVNPLGHYRPLPFTLWRLIYLATGGLRPDTLHLLNMLAHATSGLLIGLLLARVWRPADLSAPLTAAVFVAFPLTFDAVLWASSFAYPLVTALGMAAVLAYLRARDLNSWRWHVVALGLTVLAGFAHQSGVALGLTILLAEHLPRVKRDYRWACAHLAAASVPLFAILRFQSVPVDRLRLPDLLGNLGMTLQLLVYPMAPVGAWLQQGLHIPAAWLAVGGLLVLAVLGLGLWRAGLGRWCVFGLGWALLWNAIPLLTQRYDWSRDPARAFYSGTPGIAMLWALALGAVARWGAGGRLNAWARWVPALAATAILLPAAGFVLGRTELYQRGGDLLWQVTGQALVEPRALFVNVPGRMTPARRTYPMGLEGVVLLPPPTDDVRLLVRANVPQAAPELEASAAAAGAIMPRLPYGVETMGPVLNTEAMRRAERVYVVEYQADGNLQVRDAGAIIGVGGPLNALAVFGGNIRLLEARCQRAADGRLTLTNLWQSARPDTVGAVAFVHLMVGGELIEQADGAPLRGLYPFSGWLPDERVEDVRIFETAPAGPATIRMGLWQPELGQRLTAVDSNGATLPDGIFSVTCREGQE